MERGHGEAFVDIGKNKGDYDLNNACSTLKSKDTGIERSVPLIRFQSRVFPWGSPAFAPAIRRCVLP
jgi:hypothetical protein